MHLPGGQGTCPEKKAVVGVLTGIYHVCNDITRQYYTHGLQELKGGGGGGPAGDIFVTSTVIIFHDNSSRTNGALTPEE